MGWGAPTRLFARWGEVRRDTTPYVAALCFLVSFYENRGVEWVSKAWARRHDASRRLRCRPGRSEGCGQTSGWRVLLYVRRFLVLSGRIWIFLLLQTNTLLFRDSRRLIGSHSTRWLSSCYCSRHACIYIKCYQSVGMLYLPGPVYCNVTRRDCSVSLSVWMCKRGIIIAN